jgi:hypothetical protein
MTGIPQPQVRYLLVYIQQVCRWLCHTAVIPILTARTRSYVNGMEPTTSAMETQVLASRNVWNPLNERG